MKVSFQYDRNEGFTTNVEGKEKISIKNSLVGNVKNFAPTELLLMAIGSCSSDDVLSILNKMREKVEDYQCEITGERKEEIPKTLERVNVKYNFTGNLNPEKVRKAINLSLTKYCSVSILAKRGGAEVTYSFSIDGKDYDLERLPEVPTLL